MKMTLPVVPLQSLWHSKNHILKDRGWGTPRHTTPRLITEMVFSHHMPPSREMRETRPPGHPSYTWDARNRLKQMDLGNTASFTYDPFGRRATKTIAGTGTAFLYDGANLVQEVIGGTN